MYMLLAILCTTAIWLRLITSKITYPYGHNFRGKRYIIANNPNDRQTGSDARIRCRQLKGVLATIKSKQELEHLVRAIEQKNIQSWTFYIGGRRNAKGEWITENGSKMKFNNWQSNQPSGDTANKCVKLRPNHNGGKWYNVRCNDRYRERHHYICEPAKPMPGCKKPYFLKYENTCIALMKHAMGLQAAKDECKRNKGHILTMESSGMQRYMREELQGTGVSNWRIDGYRSGGAFKDRKGKDLRYTNWARSKPGNMAADRCIALSMGHDNNGQWKDEPCRVLSFICGSPVIVDGGWSEWKKTKCTVTCGGGITSKTRKCNNPKPSATGNACKGDGSEERACNIKVCPVNGRWGMWTNWNLCSRSCGRGVRTRTRSCDFPKPTHGGHGCRGSAKERKVCAHVRCNKIAEHQATVPAVCSIPFEYNNSVFYGCVSNDAGHFACPNMPIVVNGVTKWIKCKNQAEITVCTNGQFELSCSSQSVLFITDVKVLKGAKYCVSRQKSPSLGHVRVKRDNLRYVEIVDKAKVSSISAKELPGVLLKQVRKQCDQDTKCTFSPSDGIQRALKKHGRIAPLAIKVSYDCTKQLNKDDGGCKFSFKYSNKHFFTCVTTNSDEKPWCGTNVDVNRHDLDTKPCPEAVIERRGVTKLNWKCSPTFRYRTKVIKGCTRLTSSPERKTKYPWCATTSNYDEDRAWINCHSSNQST